MTRDGTVGRFRRNREKPAASSGHRSRSNDEDSVRGPHQGQQSTRTAPTGRTHDCKRLLCGTLNFLLPGGGHPHMKRRAFITRVGGAIVPVILITASLVWPGWLRTAQAQSWMSEKGGGVRHIVVTLNKSATLRFDKPFASAVVGAPDIVDALPMSDRVLYIQGKKVGTTNVSVFDQSMKLIGVLDVEVAIDTGNL